MTIPKYIIKTPLFQNTKSSYYHINIAEGKYDGLQFNFSKIEIVEENEEKHIKFEYNLLRIPNDVEVDIELEQLVADILQDIIEKGNYYELDTK